MSSEEEKRATRDRQTRFKAGKLALGSRRIHFYISKGLIQRLDKYARALEASRRKTITRQAALSHLLATALGEWLKRTSAQGKSAKLLAADGTEESRKAHEDFIDEFKHQLHVAIASSPSIATSSVLLETVELCLQRATDKLIRPNSASS